jgi:hypothetical protein
VLPYTNQNRPIQVYEQIENSVQAMLNTLNDIRSMCGVVPIPAERLTGPGGLQQRIVSLRSYLNSTIGMTGLQAFMRGSTGLNNATYDWSAAVAATTNPGQAVINWIKNNAATAPNPSDGSDNPQARTVDGTSLGPLIDSLITSITT